MRLSFWLTGLFAVFFFLGPKASALILASSDSFEPMTPPAFEMEPSMSDYDLNWRDWKNEEGHEEFFIGGMRIISATFGGNVHAPKGNANTVVMRLCFGKPSCDIFVSVNAFGDPAPGRDKDFVVIYDCNDSKTRNRSLPPDATGQVLHLDCK